MLKIEFNQKNAPQKILCLGAHSDDIEIGCGGTILKILSVYNNVEVFWVVFSGDTVRKNEAIRSANVFLMHSNEKTIMVKNYKDSFFPFYGAEIKEYFEQIKQEFHPDLVFSHYRKDLHQDHRLISDLTWNTFRNHLILEYEIPKYDGDIGRPNIFVQISDDISAKKINYILRHFESQKDNAWFESETFRSILRIRGMESNSPSKYAEAFHCRKIVLF